MSARPDVFWHVEHLRFIHLLDFLDAQRRLLRAGLHADFGGMLQAIEFLNVF